MILNEKWLEELPQPIIDVYQKASIDITSVIIRRVKQIGKLTPTDINRLNIAVRYMGADLNEIKKVIAFTTKKSEKAVNNILAEASAENDTFAKVFYDAKGLPSINYLNDDYLNKLVSSVAKATNTMYANILNLSGTTLCYNVASRKPMRIQEAYTSVINDAILKVKAGLSYETVIRDAVKRLGSGVCVYENGYTRRLDSMVRQNTLDTVRKISQEEMLYHGERFGADGIELSAHAISAPDHVGVQGRQFTNEQFENMQNGEASVDVYGEYHPPFERPIGEWNCKHFVMPIVVGLSAPTYDENQLRDMASNSAEKYGKTQKMRAMETNLRKLKEQRMLLDGDSAKELQRKINKKQRDYKNYCNSNGLTPQTKRASVYGYRPISTK